MEGARISSRQFFYLILCMVLSLSLGHVPALLVRYARQGLWLSVLLATAGDIAVAVMLYVLGRRFPGQTLYEYSRSILGPIAGSLAALAYAWLFLFAAALSIRVLSDLFQLIMPETPAPFFVWALALNGGYGAKKGLEAVGRASELLGPLAVLASLGIVVGTANRWDLGFLFPALPDPGRAVFASLLPASWFGICTIMGVLMAYHAEPARALLVKASGVVLGAGLILAMTLAALVTMGPSLAAAQTVPIYSAARLIEFGRFVERVELLFLSAALVPGLSSHALLLYGSSLGVAQVFRLADHRPLVWPVATLAAVLASGSVRSHAQLYRFLEQAYPLYALSIELGLTTLLLALAFLSGRRGVRPRARAAATASPARTGR